MNQELLLQILQGVLVLAVPTIGGFLVKFLQSHVSANTMIVLQNEAHAVVQATEQMAESGQIDKNSKLGTALSTLKQLFPGEEETRLRQYIESSVYTLPKMLTATLGESIAPVADASKDPVMIDSPPAATPSI